MYIKDVAGDGNCLFRAVSDQIEGTPEKYDSIRQRCVTFIEQNPDDFAPFIEDDVTFDKVSSSRVLNNTTYNSSTTNCI